MSASTPVQQCAALADLLANTARHELAPRLRSLLPEARKAAVREYWLAQMADLGGIGQAVAKRIEEAK